MKTAAKALALTACALLASCAAASPGPKGWQPMPGASGAWSNPSGSQEYHYSRAGFGGTLQDLASRVAIDVVLHEHGAPGARLQSTPFAACPGVAGLATFKVAGGKTLTEGFAVHDGEAVRVRYIRRSTEEFDAAAEQAMQAVLCA